jgi:hypothetical protein
MPVKWFRLAERQRNPCESRIAIANSDEGYSVIATAPQANGGNLLQWHIDFAMYLQKIRFVSSPIRH